MCTSKALRIGNSNHTNFKKGFSSWKFSKDCKSSVTTPIYKDGDKRNVRNYKPITLLNVFAKLFESSHKVKNTRKNSKVLRFY